MHARLYAACDVTLIMELPVEIRCGVEFNKALVDTLQHTVLNQMADIRKKLLVLIYVDAN